MRGVGLPPSLLLAFIPIRFDMLFRNIQTLLQTDDHTPRTIVRGGDMQHLPHHHNAFLHIEGGRVVDFGPMHRCPENVSGETVDATGRIVLPSWCDSHTHIVYAAPRETEFVDRIKGLTYEQIAERGGGILNSARRLADTSEDALFASALVRLREVEQYGTGCLEIKSGYGLSTDSELKMLRVIQRLKAETRIRIRATFLGAHAIPAEYRHRREAYIALLIEEMIPRVTAEGLADYCDVFCDTGFYTPEETDRILKAATQYGLRAKIHANELAVSGGVQVGVANHAVSVDHLERISAAEIECLLASDTIPTALPGTSFFLGIPYAPARAMIDAGLPLALATDYNPGSTPSGSVPMLLALACTQMKMLPEEAINAVTINGAAALELGAEFGTIARGKVANVILTTPVPSVAFLPYAYGTNWIERVWLQGEACM